MLIIDTEGQVKNLEIEFDILKTINDCFAFIISSPSSNKEYDLVPRFFTTNAEIMEDPVTRSSHCTLIPFWAERYNKNELIAKQLSKKGGTLYCENNGTRIEISRKAKLYLEGNIKI